MEFGLWYLFECKEKAVSRGLLVALKQNCNSYLSHLCNEQREKNE